MDNTTKNIILDLLKGDQDVAAYILTATDENYHMYSLMSGTGKQLMTVAIATVSQLINTTTEEAPDEIKEGVKHYMRDEFVRGLNAVLDREEE